METVISYVSFAWSGESIVAPTAGGNVPEFGIHVEDFKGLFNDGIATQESIPRWGGHGSILPDDVWREGKSIEMTLMIRASSAENTRAMYSKIKRMARAQRIIVNTNWVGPYTCAVIDGSTEDTWLSEKMVRITFDLKAEESE